MKSAVFLDRDGVINVNRLDHVKSWQEWAFLPGVFEPLRLLAQSNRAIVVVSNQSCIGRGLVDAEVVEAIHRAMVEEISRQGGRVDAVFFCIDPMKVVIVESHSPDCCCGRLRSSASA